MGLVFSITAILYQNSMRLCGWRFPNIRRYCPVDYVAGLQRKTVYAKVVVVEFLRIWNLAANYLRELLELSCVPVAHRAEHDVVLYEHVRRLRLLQEQLYRDLLVDLFNLHAAFLASGVPHAAEVLYGF